MKGPLSIHTFIGVGTEIVALRLKKVMGKAFASISVIIGEG